MLLVPACRKRAELYVAIGGNSGRFQESIIHLYKQKGILKSTTTAGHRSFLSCGADTCKGPAESLDQTRVKADNATRVATQ